MCDRYRGKRRCGNRRVLRQSISNHFVAVQNPLLGFVAARIEFGTAIGASSAVISRAEHLRVPPGRKQLQLIEFISSASLLSYLEARLEVSSQNTTFLPCSSTSVNSSNDFFEAGSDGGSSFSLLPWPTLRHFSAYLAEPLPPPFTSAATFWLDLVVTFS